MKRNFGYRILAAALCLLLAGCGKTAPQPDLTPSPSQTPAVTVTPAPSPAPSPSPAPTEAPRRTPEEVLAAALDQVVSGEEIFIRFWQHPGSGPSPISLPPAEYGAPIRALFEALDWEETEEPAYTDAATEAPYNQPGAYQASLHFGESSRDLGDGWIGLGTGDPVIMVGTNGPDSVYLRAEGAEALCDALADLMPSVYINLGRTRVPPQESKAATLKRYLETALERTKALGHITEYELRAYAVVTWSEEEHAYVEVTERPEEAEPSGFQYTAVYAYKPAQPELERWKAYPHDADGWIVDTIEAASECLGYDERDGCYGMY